MRIFPPASHLHIYMRAECIDRPIAVFDSGLGGISVLRELVRQMPDEKFLYFGDSENVPYGSRPIEEIRELTLRHAKMLFERGAKALVIACNTATSVAIQELRSLYPDRIIIGIEPALKPAVERYPNGKILVMATETTLRERKFATLMEQNAEACEICKCPCPDLVQFVERGELCGGAVEQSLRKHLQKCLRTPVDAIVLGCTHFPFLKAAIRAVIGEKPEIFDGADGTAKETRRRIAEAGLLRQGEGSVELKNSLCSAEIMRLSQKLLNTV